MKTISVVELYTAANKRVLIIPDAREGVNYRGFYTADEESGELHFHFGTFVDNDAAAINLALSNL